MVLLVITESYTHWEEGVIKRIGMGGKVYHMVGVKELPGRIGIPIPKPVPFLRFCHELPMFSSRERPNVHRR